MKNPFFEVNPAMADADIRVMEEIAGRLAQVEAVKEYNQWKVLKAFIQNRVAATHLVGSTGYGYGDAGRERLEKVFASIVGAESALYRHGFCSGTHAISVALFGLLRPGDELLCASGTPYDTLHGVIGINGRTGSGNLHEFGVRYRQLELLAGAPDVRAIARHAPGAAVLYLQRSCGYARRPTLGLGDIAAAAQAAKTANPNIFVVVDNCYGEFTACQEPTQAGADVMIGSLIKNPGGGIAPTGGYIAGQAELVERCAQRMTAPGVGAEVGSCPGDVLRQLWLGLYFAPGVTAEAMKTAVYASALFEQLGYAAAPSWREETRDIITAVTLKNRQQLERLCRTVQAMSPVDSHLTPQAWPMPGYGDEVIMAAGAFTGGSSIELSCDAPLRQPYTAYLQGSLNFAAGRAAVLCAAQAALSAREMAQ